MGLKVSDDRFIKMLKEVSSGCWDILNFNFNRGSEYVVTFCEEANRAHQERVRISSRLAKSLATFMLSEHERAASEEAIGL